MCSDCLGCLCAIFLFDHLFVLCASVSDVKLPIWFLFRKVNDKSYWFNDSKLYSLLRRKTIWYRCYCIILFIELSVYSYKPLKEHRCKRYYRAHLLFVYSQVKMLLLVTLLFFVSVSLPPWYQHYEFSMSKPRAACDRRLWNGSLQNKFLQFFQLVITLSPGLEVFNGLWPVTIPSVLQKICMASCAESWVWNIFRCWNSWCVHGLNSSLAGYLEENWHCWLKYIHF